MSKFILITNEELLTKSNFIHIHTGPIINNEYYIYWKSNNNYYKTLNNFQK